MPILSESVKGELGAAACCPSLVSLSGEYWTASDRSMSPMPKLYDMHTEAYRNRSCPRSA